MVPMKKDSEQAGGRYPLLQEMRISQLVLDPTSHVDSKNLKAGSSPCLAVNTPLTTAIKCPTPLVVSRRTTQRQEAQGKDADTYAVVLLQ